MEPSMSPEYRLTLARTRERERRAPGGRVVSERFHTSHSMNGHRGKRETFQRFHRFFCYILAERPPSSSNMYSLRDAIFALLAALSAAGCIYPPTTQPPPDAHQQVVIPLPYDLAWDAVNHVIAQNSLRIQAQDSNAGIIETVGPRFTLHDADCGRIQLE